MKKIIFRGRDDLRTLKAEDLAKVGVGKFETTTFRKDEPVELHNASVEAILDNPGLFGPFEEFVEEKPKKTSSSESTTATKAASTGSASTDQVS